jgi:uncharacterized protein (DUF2141 family)
VGLSAALAACRQSFRGWPLGALAILLTLSRTTHGDSAATRPAADGFDLTVRVSQLRNERGRVAVAVFASASDFPDQKRALAGQLAKIEKGRASVKFTGLKPGLYAVAVLHDENENDKMDFNFLGMPLEGYGFSNDASAAFGPPSFEAAAFKLSPRASYIAVKARYFL